MTRAANAVLAASLVAFAASLCLLDIASWDYWSHLRTGQLIFDTGTIPKRDVYTYSVRGARYVDIHWLFQLALYGLYALAGHAGVVLGKLGFVFALLALLWPIGYQRERAAVSALALGLMLVLAAERIMPRPDLVSFVLLAAVLGLLERARERPGVFLYAVVGIQALWANVHGLFALGIAVCGIHLVGELLEQLAAREWRPNRIRPLATVTLLSAVAALANPNRLDGALYPIAQLGMIGTRAGRELGGNIAELQPALPGLSSTGLAFACALAALSLAALALNWRRLRFADFVLWCAFLYLGFAARRNLALFGIVSVPILVRNLNQALAERGLLESRRVIVGSTVIASVALLLGSIDVAGGHFHARLGLAREPGFGLMDTHYATRAASWIDAERPPAPIAHHLPDGALLIWRLYPDYRVLVDGRLEVFGAEQLAELELAGPNEFQQLDGRYRFGTVLLHYSKIRSDDLLYWLQQSPAWKLAFVDEVSALFVRREAPGGERFRELDIDDGALFAPLVDAGRVQTELRARGRALFYSALGRHDRAAESIAWADARYPDIRWGFEER